MERERSPWHDDWLIENIDEYQNYTKLLEAYNAEFQTKYSLAGIKNHCRIALKLSKERKAYRHYTDEQLEFLRVNYPKYGERKTLEMFNEKFNETRAMSSMKNFGTYHRVICDPQEKQKRRRERLDSEHSARRTKAVGDTRLECGRLVMKAADGKWYSAAKVVFEAKYGPVPPGYVVTVLDGNNHNVEIENLAAVPVKYLGLLQRYNLRSENPIITKTGILWCQLFEALQKSERGEV